MAKNDIASRVYNHTWKLAHEFQTTGISPRQT